MRNISTAFRRAIFGASTAEVVLVLLEITHPDLSTSIYTVNNNEAVVSNGNTYLPFPFQIAFPTSQANQLPQSTLVIDNINLSVQDALKSIRTAPKVTMKVILASALDNIEAQFPFILKSVVINNLTIQATLSAPLINNEPFPWITFSRDKFPALFQIK